MDEFLIVVVVAIAVGLTFLVLYAIDLRIKQTMLNNAFKLKSVFPASEEDCRLLSNSVRGLYTDTKTKPMVGSGYSCFVAATDDHVIMCIRRGPAAILCRRQGGAFTVSLKIPLEKIRLVDTDIEFSLTSRITLRVPLKDQKYNKYAIDDFPPRIFLPSDITSVYPNFPDKKNKGGKGPSAPKASPDANQAPENQEPEQAKE